MVQPFSITWMLFMVRLHDNVENPSVMTEERDLCDLDLLFDLLESRLVERIRFKLGKVYTINVSMDFSYSSPDPSKTLRGGVFVELGCDPDEAPKLIDVILAEVKELEDTGFKQEEIDTMKSKTMREHEERLRTNWYWAEELLAGALARESLPLPDVLSHRANAFQASLDELTPESTKASLRRFVPLGKAGLPKSYFAATLKPLRIWDTWWGRAVPLVSMLALIPFLHWMGKR
jgi:hypothetical protein